MTSVTDPMVTATPVVPLPTTGGSLSPYVMQGPADWYGEALGDGFTSRTAFAAAHVVADPCAINSHGQAAKLDWDATLAYRHHLWRQGFAVAEAMDTAQRGMGLDWDATTELIRQSSAEAASVGGRIACGAGTDHVAPHLDNLDQVVAAYLEQIEVVRNAGSDVILMASRQLAALAQGPQDYAQVYHRVLAEVDTPVILHWLGPMFDPALTGYWGSENTDEATEQVLSVIEEHSDKVDGIKVSLLDAEHEKGLRRRLPEGVRLYTGDDFNYPELILGDDGYFSHALLGIFDAIAPAATAALKALDRGDHDRYLEILAPTVPLSRHVFAQPTWFYKTGLTFIAWLAGHQDAFTMVGGLQSGRSIVDLGETLRLADAAGLFRDPEMVANRWASLLAVHGIES